jgi:hypothetical protein
VLSFIVCIFRTKKFRSYSARYFPKSIEICKARGVKNAICEDLLQFSERFRYHFAFDEWNWDFSKFKNIDQYLQKLKNLISENGQILLDSTDILYMYDQDEDGGVLVPATGYYGELDYYIHYKGESELPMKWLYLDFNTLMLRLLMVLKFRK